MQKLSAVTLLRQLNTLSNAGRPLYSKPTKPLTRNTSQRTGLPKPGAWAVSTHYTVIPLHWFCHQLAGQWN